MHVVVLMTNLQTRNRTKGDNLPRVPRLANPGIIVDEHSSPSHIFTDDSFLQSRRRKSIYPEAAKVRKSHFALT